MSQISIYAGDTLVVQVTTTDANTGSAKDITGATVTANAKDIRGKVLPGDVALTTPASGIFTITYGAGVLKRGRWILQSRVVLGPESQIVSEESIEVKPSHV